MASRTPSPDGPWPCPFLKSLAPSPFLSSPHPRPAPQPGATHAATHSSCASGLSLLGTKRREVTVELREGGGQGQARTAGTA